MIDIWGFIKRLSYSQWLTRVAFFSMILLKIIGLLTWPWWMVLAPLWMIPVVACMVLILAVLGEITYPLWEPIYKSYCRKINNYNKRVKEDKKRIKWQSLTKSQNILHVVKRTLRFLFIG